MLFTGNALRLFALTTIAAVIADAAPSTSRPLASTTRHRPRSTAADGSWDGCQYHVQSAGQFTSHFSFDFTTMDSLPDEFIPSTYEVGSGPYAPYAHIFNPDNIVLGNGQPMQMIVPGGQTADPLDTCQLVTRYDDVLYASVRTVAQVSPVNGTVHGFFMYMNDTQETDIEIRTGDLGNVHFTNQQTHPGNGETTYPVAAPADMTSAFHEYRYDWLPTVTNFYIDGELVMEISRNVPSEPGWLMWNNWANGYAWTWGPPLQDNILLIQSVEAYFNRTSVDVSSCEATAASSGTNASPATTSAGSRVTLNAAAASSHTSSATALQTSEADAGVTETSTSASATSTAYADGSTPVVAGVSFSVQTDTSYSGTLLNLLRKRTSSTVDDCLRTCAASSSCVGTAFNSDSSTCSYYSAFDKNSKTTNPGVTFATVQDRESSSSSASAAATSSVVFVDTTSTQDVATSSSAATSTNSLAASSAATTDSTISSAASSTQDMATSSPAFTSPVETASSSSTVVLSVSSSTTSATPTPTVSITCPDFNNTLYTDSTSNLSFYIECGMDHAGGDLSMVYVSGLAGCIAACAQTAGCVDVSLSGAACYMKKSVGPVVDSGGILGARLSTSASSTTSTSTSSASSSATAAYTRPAFQQLLQAYIDARLVVPSS